MRHFTPSAAPAGVVQKRHDRVTDAAAGVPTLKLKPKQNPKLNPKPATRNAMIGSAVAITGVLLYSLAEKPAAKKPADKKH